MARLDALLVGAEQLENLSTRYLSAVLREHGFSVQLAAFSHVGEMDAVLRHAEWAQPRLIGLSIIFQYRAPEFLELAARLRRVVPDAHITTGGHFATFAAGELLVDHPALDSVVRGEGEFTLLELARDLDRPSAWADIRGLSFRRDGQVVDTPPRPLAANLDDLPFPSRDTPPQYHLGIGYAPITGSRGCYANCSFCSIHSFYESSGGKLQRFRSVPDLVDEMEHLHVQSGVRLFVFNDDEWFPPGKARYRRVSQLRSELARRGLDVIMSIKCRADDVEPALFAELLEMGVVRAYVGVESGSDHSLGMLNKRTTVAQNRRALQVLHEQGMLADFGLIFFDPDSTVEDIRANLDFLREMGGEGQAPLSFGRMEVYAGTPVLERLQREGRLTGSYMAWNYVIPDPRVELMWRLMITAMRRRQYEDSGLGKQCSIAYYELTIFKYLHSGCYDPLLGDRLKDIVARVNNHSLDILEEMFHFTLDADIHDHALVNDRALDWATRVNAFDLAAEAELTEWRELVTSRVLGG